MGRSHSLVRRSSRRGPQGRTIHRDSRGSPMTDVLEFQRRIAGAVMSPLNASISATADQLVKPNDRLTPTERLNIYHRQYWYRILDSFNEDFPGVCSIVGERAFE